MDKQTLSNYGWLVIVTLILAVMLALATPFGTYVGDAVVSVANGYVGASNNAIDDDNISSMQSKWEEKLNPVVAGATFSGYLINPDCHTYINQHTDSCFEDCNDFLTWDELKLEKNGTKYGYDAFAISDTTVDRGAFAGCRFLSSITLPEGLTSIGDYLFEICFRLTSITFKGTMAQWNTISKGEGWNYLISATVVHCTDGDVAI